MGVQSAVGRLISRRQELPRFFIRTVHQRKNTDEAFQAVKMTKGKDAANPLVPVLIRRKITSLHVSAMIAVTFGVLVTMYVLCLFTGCTNLCLFTYTYIICIREDWRSRARVLQLTHCCQFISVTFTRTKKLFISRIRICSR